MSDNVLSNEHCAWHERQYDDLLAHTVELARRSAGPCLMCGYSRLMTCYTGAGFRVEQRCDECNPTRVRVTGAGFVVR